MIACAFVYITYYDVSHKYGLLVFLNSQISINASIHICFFGSYLISLPTNVYIHIAFLLLRFGLSSTQFDETGHVWILKTIWIECNIYVLVSSSTLWLNFRIPSCLSDACILRVLIYWSTSVCIPDGAFLECPTFKCLDGYMCHLYQFAIFPIASEVALCGY